VQSKGRNAAALFVCRAGPERVLTPLFVGAHMTIRFTQKSISLDTDLETPVGLFLRLVGEHPGILLESAEVDGRWGRYSLIASDFVISTSCDKGLFDVKVEDPRLNNLKRLTGLPFIDGLRQLMQSLFFEKTEEPLAPITRALYGYFGYGVAGLLEPKLADSLPPEEAEASLVLPGTLIIFDHCYRKITRLDLCIEGQEIQPLQPILLEGKESRPSTLPGLDEKAAYIKAVEQVKNEIRQGEAMQVVLSVPFNTALTEEPFEYYRRLRRINPSPYLFYMKLPSSAACVLLGSSPEVLVSCNANRLLLCPIAGTRPRSQNQIEDALFGNELLQDPKEKAEHVMLVDLGRNDLGKIAKPGSVTLERFMEVERFSHVMHLVSRIQADLLPGYDAVDVLRATFPAGTVSGAPKIRAIDMIAKTEKRPRGPYAGALGWLGLDKDTVSLDLGIVIRSLWVRDGYVSWQAGAGIVYDSVAEKEWQECCVKAAVIRKVVLGG